MQLPEGIGESTELSDLEGSTQLLEKMIHSRVTNIIAFSMDPGEIKCKWRRKKRQGLSDPRGYKNYVPCVSPASWKERKRRTRLKKYLEK